MCKTCYNAPASDRCYENCKRIQEPPPMSEIQPFYASLSYRPDKGVYCVKCGHSVPDVKEDDKLLRVNQ